MGEAADFPDPAAAGLRRLRLAVTVLGPITIVTALLYYYSYVTTYAQYAYFGVNVELLNYSSADYVLRSPASLFAPLLVLLVLVGVGLLGACEPRWLGSADHASTPSQGRLLGGHRRRRRSLVPSGPWHR